MNKLLTALIAVAFAATAFAQGPAPATTAPAAPAAATPGQGIRNGDAAGEADQGSEAAGNEEEEKGG
jgi:hypothetical protein